MAGKVKNFLLLMAFSLFSLACYCQTKMPPPPQMKQASTQGDGPPCANQGDGDGGPGTPPPPGLCLPIDDYIVYLLVAGILYGAYRTHRLQKV